MRPAGDTRRHTARHAPAAGRPHVCRVIGPPGRASTRSPAGPRRTSPRAGGSRRPARARRRRSTSPVPPEPAARGRPAAPSRIRAQRAVQALGPGPPANRIVGRDPGGTVIAGRLHDPRRVRREPVPGVGAEVAGHAPSIRQHEDGGGRPGPGPATTSGRAARRPATPRPAARPWWARPTRERHSPAPGHRTRSASPAPGAGPAGHRDRRERRQAQRPPRDAHRGRAELATGSSAGSPDRLRARRRARRGHRHGHGGRRRRRRGPRWTASEQGPVVAGRPDVEARRVRPGGGAGTHRRDVAPARAQALLEHDRPRRDRVVRQPARPVAARATR